MKIMLCSRAQAQVFLYLHRRDTTGMVCVCPGGERECSEHTHHDDSQTARLMDGGWQKAMPEHDKIELWDISPLDSLNKQRAAGGHRGHGCGHPGMAQYRREGEGRKGDKRGSGGMRHHSITVMSAHVNCNQHWL